MAQKDYVLRLCLRMRNLDSHGSVNCASASSLLGQSLRGTNMSTKTYGHICVQFYIAQYRTLRTNLGVSGCNTRRRCTGKAGNLSRVAIRLFNRRKPSENTLRVYMQIADWMREWSNIFAAVKFKQYSRGGRLVRSALSPWPPRQNIGLIWVGTLKSWLYALYLFI